MPLSDRPSGSGQHVHPVPQLSAHTIGSYLRLANRIAGTDAVVVNYGSFDGNLVDLIEGNLKLERFVEVGIEGALLDRSLLFLDPLAC